MHSLPFVCGCYPVRFFGKLRQCQLIFTLTGLVEHIHDAQFIVLGDSGVEEDQQLIQDILTSRLRVVLLSTRLKARKTEVATAAVVLTTISSVKK